MIKFGTGGWRAIIGDDFVRENIEKVAMGMVLMMREQKRTEKPVPIGFDRRFVIGGSFPLHKGDGIFPFFCVLFPVDHLYHLICNLIILDY